MTIPLKSLFVTSVLLGLVSWGASHAPDSQLVAMSSALGSMTDTDGDGLDDVLEVLLGTSISDADTDNDLRSDLDEHLTGSDPLTFDGSGRPAAIQRNIKMDIYSNGDDVVVQVSGIYSQSMRGIKLYAATEDRFIQLRPRALPLTNSDTRVLSSGLPGLQTKVHRMSFPKDVFHRVPAMAIGLTAFVDGVEMGAQVQLLSRQDHLLEYRDGETFGRQSQGSGQTGGLFPTSPGDSMPGEISLGQICVQTLQEVAALGGGQKLYQVSDSYCDYLPDAACFSSCSGAIGNSVVGIDIVGLLGG
jgi:hypothetical protein